MSKQFNEVDVNDEVNNEIKENEVKESRVKAFASSVAAGAKKAVPFIIGGFVIACGIGIAVVKSMASKDDYDSVSDTESETKTEETTI